MVLAQVPDHQWGTYQPLRFLLLILTLHSVCQQYYCCCDSKVSCFLFYLFLFRVIINLSPFRSFLKWKFKYWRKSLYLSFHPFLILASLFPPRRKFWSLWCALTCSGLDEFWELWFENKAWGRLACHCPPGDAQFLPLLIWCALVPHGSPLYSFCLSHPAEHIRRDRQRHIPARAWGARDSQLWASGHLGKLLGSAWAWLSEDPEPWWLWYGGNLLWEVRRFQL